MKDLRSVWTGYVAVALLLPLASCLAPDNAPQATPRSAESFGLRGPVDGETELITGSITPSAPLPAPVPQVSLSQAPAQSAVPFMGPDETVASASIAESLNTHPRFAIEMGFAPGDGATSLKAALAKALDDVPPSGQSGQYRLRGTVTVENTDTGDIRVRINWLLTRADGKEIGSVEQQSDTNPSDIAAYWGDFARSSAKPAVEGIYALLSTESRPKRNAS
ncbi:MAG: hypothetical protein ACOH12_14750 [Parvibaculaceae bacterium]